MKRDELIDFMTWLYPTIGVEELDENEFEELADAYLKSINDAQSESQNVRDNEYKGEFLKPRYCSRCGEPLGRKHKFWCPL